MRVLVVEDEADLRRALVQSLDETGYAVDQASDGEEGIQKATTWDYDAVVLDIMLPRRNGWEVLQTLRQSKRTPVLILSARDALLDRIRGLDGGADDYLVKPFSFVELHARLRALIRRSVGQASSIVQIGGIAIDTTKHTVTKDGETVVLTPREYALVELLALHRGRLISRTLIYDHIFGEDDSSLSNLVDVHVSHIRKKLGSGFISTRRGQGYIIDG